MLTKEKLKNKLDSESYAIYIQGSTILVDELEDSFKEGTLL